MCIYVYVYMYICIYVYMYVYKYVCVCQVRIRIYDITIHSFQSLPHTWCLMSVSPTRHARCSRFDSQWEKVLLSEFCVRWSIMTSWRHAEVRTGTVSLDSFKSTIYLSKFRSQISYILSQVKSNEVKLSQIKSNIWWMGAKSCTACPSW